MKLCSFFYWLLMTSMGLEVYGQWMPGQENLSTPNIIEPQKMSSVLEIFAVRKDVKVRQKPTLSPKVRTLPPKLTSLPTISTLRSSTPKIIVKKETITSQNLGLSFGLYRELMSTNRDKNFMFSPPTFSLALTMLGLQASPFTRRNVLRILRLSSKVISKAPSDRDHYNLGKFLQSQLPSSEGCQCELRSMVVGTQTYEQLQEKFVNMAWNSYHTNVLVLPPTLPQTTEHQTRVFKKEKTQDQKGPFEKRNTFDLSSAISFKGKWTNFFEKNLTMPFRVRSDFQVVVPAMQHEGLFRLQYCSPLKSYVLQLPYTCNSTSYFIMPDDRSNRATEDIPLSTHFEDWVPLFPPSLWKLHIPKFTVSGLSSLENLLPNMGFWDIFSPSHAGISGIFVKDQNYSIERMLHGAQLTVDETGVKNKKKKKKKYQTKYKPRVRTFYFNRPFVIVILTQNNEVIVMGRVMDPMKNT